MCDEEKIEVCFHVKSGKGIARDLASSSRNELRNNPEFDSVVIKFVNSESMIKICVDKDKDENLCEKALEFILDKPRNEKFKAKLNYKRIYPKKSERQKKVEIDDKPKEDSYRFEAVKETIEDKILNKVNEKKDISAEFYELWGEFSGKRDIFIDDYDYFIEKYALFSAQMDKINGLLGEIDDINIELIESKRVHKKIIINPHDLAPPKLLSKRHSDDYKRFLQASKKLAEFVKRYGAFFDEQKEVDKELYIEAKEALLSKNSFVDRDEAEKVVKSYELHQLNQGELKRLEEEKDFWKKRCADISFYFNFIDYCSREELFIADFDGNESELEKVILDVAEEIFGKPELFEGLMRYYDENMINNRSDKQFFEKIYGRLEELEFSIIPKYISLKRIHLSQSSEMLQTFSELIDERMESYYSALVKKYQETNIPEASELYVEYDNSENAILFKNRISQLNDILKTMSVIEEKIIKIDLEIDQKLEDYKRNYSDLERKKKNLQDKLDSLKSNLSDDDISVSESDFYLSYFRSDDTSEEIKKAYSFLKSITKEGVVQDSSDYFKALEMWNSYELQLTIIRDQETKLFISETGGCEFKEDMLSSAKEVFGEYEKEEDQYVFLPGEDAHIEIFLKKFQKDFKKRSQGLGINLDILYITEK